MPSGAKAGRDVNGQEDAPSHRNPMCQEATGNIGAYFSPARNCHQLRILSSIAEFRLIKVAREVKKVKTRRTPELT